MKTAGTSLRITSVKLFLKGGDSKCVSREEVKVLLAWLVEEIAIAVVCRSGVFFIQGGTGMAGELQRPAEKGTGRGRRTYQGIKMRP